MEKWQTLWTCLSIVLLTFLSDVTELAFSNLIFFIRTLRFWLYFLAHSGLSFLAAYILHRTHTINQWYLLAVAATFLGAGLVARTNVEIAGLSLAPIGKIFAALKAKMLEQAAEVKFERIYLGRLVEKLQQGFTVKVIESLHRAGLMAVPVKVEQIQEMQNEARSRSSDDESYKSLLIEQLIKKNRGYAEDCIKKGYGKN